MTNLNSPAQLSRIGDQKREAVIYTISVCPWCVKAKRLMEEFDIEYTEIDGFHKDHPTVPYIIINDEVVGGYGELRGYVADL